VQVYLICDIIEGQDAGDWKVGSGKWAAVRSLGLPDPWARVLVSPYVCGH